MHDARIATFGERAEDLFQITDEHDQPLDATEQDCLREALRARLDRDAREPDSLKTGVPADGHAKAEEVRYQDRAQAPRRTCRSYWTS